MSLTVAQARDEMLGRLQSILAASTQSSAVRIYDDRQKDPPRTPTGTDARPWIRMVIRHAAGGQASLSGALGTQRWSRRGFVIVQLFTPSGGGQAIADELAAIIMGAFEGYSTPGGVWFRNVRLNEVGVDGVWFQTNVLVDFTYDEVK